MKKIILAFLLALPLSAQVQLGGHVVVPSTTDSVLGQASVVFTADGDCNIVAPVNCTVTGGPYVGTLNVTSTVTLTAPRNLFLPLSPGRTYTVFNGTAGSQGVNAIGTSGIGIQVAHGSPTTVTSDGSSYYLITTGAPAPTSVPTFSVTKSLFAQQATIPVVTPPAAWFFGDSITACYDIVASQNCYVNRVSSVFGVPPLDYAVVGQQACDVMPTQILTHYSPVVAPVQPWASLAVSTNDANYAGAGAYESTFNICHQAAVAWLTVPASDKTAGSTATTTGTCATDTTYPTFSGIQCTASGSIATLSLTTAATGPVYVWYRAIDGNTGTFTVAIDGGTAVPLTTALSPAIATQNGGTQSIAIYRIPSVGSGTHSIVFRQTAAGSMGILAVGAPDSGLPKTARPYLIVGDTPNQLDGRKQSDVNAYVADIHANISLLSGDGLVVALAPVNATLQATTAAGDMSNQSGNVLHPNDDGDNELFAAFMAPVKTGLANLAPRAYYTQNDTMKRAYTEFNPLFFNQNAGDQLNPGILVGGTGGGTSFGLDVGYIQGAFGQRLIGPDAAFPFYTAFCNIKNISTPSIQSDIGTTCPWRFSNGNTSIDSYLPHFQVTVPSTNSLLSTLVNHNAGGNSSNTLFNGGTLDYGNGTDFYGHMLGSISGTFSEQLFASTNGVVASCFHVSGTVPTSQSSFTCPYVYASDQARIAKPYYYKVPSGFQVFYQPPDDSDNAEIYGSNAANSVTAWKITNSGKVFSTANVTSSLGTGSVDTPVSVLNATGTSGQTIQQQLGIATGNNNQLTTAFVNAGGSGSGLNHGFIGMYGSVGLQGMGICSNGGITVGYSVGTLCPGGNIVFSASGNMQILATGEVDSPLVATATNTLVPINTATSLLNYASGSLLAKASYWNGTAAAVDTWSAINNPGTGANPTSTLTFGHTGSSGPASVAFPAVNSAALNNTSPTSNDLAGELTLDSGTASYTFVQPHTNHPICMANDSTAVSPVKVGYSNSGLIWTLTVTGTATDVVDYVCVGRP